MICCDLVLTVTLSSIGEKNGFTKFVSQVSFSPGGGNLPVWLFKDWTKDQYHVMKALYEKCEAIQESSFIQPVTADTLSVNIDNDDTESVSSAVSAGIVHRVRN